MITPLPHYQPVSLDETDIWLLGALQENARVSYADLSRRAKRENVADISLSGIKKRMTSLSKKIPIKFTIEYPEVVSTGDGRLYVVHTEAGGGQGEDFGVSA